MKEIWNLFTNLTLNSVPWKGQLWNMLNETTGGALTPGTTDFFRYSPTDGPIDGVHVPARMPREEPTCRTRLQIVHDEKWVNVLITAERPDTPILELAGDTREDFLLVIPLQGPARGLYFGMNEKGEAIGCVKIWDPDIQPEDTFDHWPLSLLKAKLNGPGTHHGVLSGEHYMAKVISTDKGLMGCFRIARSLIDTCLMDGVVRLSVGRTCYATGEWVSWGSPIVWTPREDRHGVVRLSQKAEPERLPCLQRVDLDYDPGSESGTFRVHWAGVGVKELACLRTGQYRDYADCTAIVLNGQEAIQPLAAISEASFPIPDGWNRLEILSGTHPAREISFEKVSARSIQAIPACTVQMPSMHEVVAAFTLWHESHERNYLGRGIWGNSQSPVHCLCHAGIFNIEPYLIAKPFLDWKPVYEERIRQTCARMLEAQHPEGWFPCFCSAVKATKPTREDGGAFTKGSVGEGLAMAARLFGEKEWLNASKRCADYAWYRLENNQNYCAFVLWHISELYGIEPREEWMNTGLYFARHFATRDIGLSGAQDGHNYFSGYGNITLKGIARFLAVLPKEHALAPWLRNKVIRFANQMLRRQQSSGLFAGRNRKFIGYHHSLPGLFFVAEALPEMADSLRPALAAQTRAVLRGGQENPTRKVSSDDGLVLALAMRFIQKNGI